MTHMTIYIELVLASPSGATKPQHRVKVRAHCWGEARHRSIGPPPPRTRAVLDAGGVISAITGMHWGKIALFDLLPGLRLELYRTGR
jgi:hypothetical protein